MDTYIPRSLRDDGMIPMNESPSYHQCIHQFVRLDDHHAALTQKDAELARLQAELDRVVKEAVKFSKYIRGRIPISMSTDEINPNAVEEEAIVFLASPLVQAWRARQGKT